MIEKPIVRTAFYDSPCGRLILGIFKGKVCLCDWVDSRHLETNKARIGNALRAVFEMTTDDATHTLTTILNEYFAGDRTALDVPIVPVGTDFQLSVWQALTTVPYGETISYTELAERIGKPRSIRAVANAVGANAISILIPCHRIIGSDGSLTGYAGGIEAKKFLLDLERR